MALPASLIRGGFERLRRPEWFFLVVFVGFGAWFVALVPPGWNSDEPNHLFRAEQISHGELLPEVWTGADGSVQSGGAVPAELIAMLARTTALTGTVFDPSAKVPDVVQDAGGNVLGPADFDPRVLADFRNTAIYSPMAYAPQVPAFWLGRLLSLSFWSITIVGRVFGLAAAGAAVFWAIRWVPWGKWVFVAAGLLPGFVSQAAAFGADSAVLALWAMLVALTLRAVASTGPLTWRTWLGLAALAAALGLTKLPYAAAAAVLLVVPLCRREPVGVRRFAVAVGWTLAALLPAVVWTGSTADAALSLNSDAVMSAQLSGLLSSPLGYPHILYRTFFTDKVGDVYSSLFGDFVWLSSPLPSLYVVLAVVMLMLSVFTTDPRESILLPNRAERIGYRVWLLVVAAGVAIVTATAVYLNYTPVGAATVEGYQGRYLLPSVIAVGLALVGNPLTRQGVPRVSIRVLSVVVLAGAVLTLIARLY